MNQGLRACLLEGERAGSRFVLAHPRSAPAGLSGTQLGSRAGSSLEFMEHREYQAGDDLRRIDWSAYARTDRMTVKLHREEVSPHLDLLLDGSRSMALPDSEKLPAPDSAPIKSRAMFGLAALLVTAADNAQFTHRAYISQSGCREIHGSHLRPGAWRVDPPDDPTNPIDAVAIHPPPFKRRGVRIMVSDLLFPGDPMSLLSTLTESASTAVVVQLLARADIDPPQRGNLRLVDSETGQVQDIFIDAADQARYRENLTRHQQLWEQACRRVGAMFFTLVAETLVEKWTPEPLMLHEILRPG